MVQRVRDVEQASHDAWVVGGLLFIHWVHGDSLRSLQACGSERPFSTAWVAEDKASEEVGTPTGAGKHIFSPSQRWPHQQRPSALMMQVPVPQHRGSSDMGLLLWGGQSK
jgi:hypothetical protein